MAVLSRLLLANVQKLSGTNGLITKLPNKNILQFQKQAGSIRCMSEHRTMPIQASRWQWHKTKDMIHLYFWVGAIPIGLIIFYANVFIGPATLEEIPEGYTPKRWEYYRSPITRFLARYVFPNPQQEYEKAMAYLYLTHLRARCRQLQNTMIESIKEHQDYPAYSYSRQIGHRLLVLHRKKMDQDPAGFAEEYFE